MRGKRARAWSCINPNLSTPGGQVLAASAASFHVGSYFCVCPPSSPREPPRRDGAGAPVGRVFSDIRPIAGLPGNDPDVKTGTEERGGVGRRWGQGSRAVRSRTGTEGSKRTSKKNQVKRGPHCPGGIRKDRRRMCGTGHKREILGSMGRSAPFSSPSNPLRSTAPSIILHE